MMTMILITVRSFFLVTGSWMVPNVDTNHHTQPLVTHSEHSIHNTIQWTTIRNAVPTTQPLVTHTVDEEAWVSPFTLAPPPPPPDPFVTSFWISDGLAGPAWSKSSDYNQLELYVRLVRLTFDIPQHLWYIPHKLYIKQGAKQWWRYIIHGIRRGCSSHWISCCTIQDNFTNTLSLLRSNNSWSV